MKSLTYVLILFSALLFAYSCVPKTDNRSVQKADISEFTGHWTMDIEGGGVGWLDVRTEDGYLDADLLWKSGSVGPVSNIYLNNHGLVVTRTENIVKKKDHNNKPVRLHTVTKWLEVYRQGDHITGYFMEPKFNGAGVDSTSFVGKKLPPVPPAPDLTRLKFGDSVVLFNGEDLTGWKLMNENMKSSFSVVDEALVVNPIQIEGQPRIQYTHLRTIEEFEDFNLTLEVNVNPRGNSGIFLRGMYEIQILDSYKDPKDQNLKNVNTDPLKNSNVLEPSGYVIPPSEEMGGVYSRIDPTIKAEKPAGMWQTLDITLCERHITVILNGIKTIDNQPVYGPTGGAIISDVFSPGPIYLQGNHYSASFRNMILTPIIK